MMAVSTEPGDASHLSTSRDRAELALPSSFVRFRKGEPLYRTGEGAEALFSIVSGVVKSYTMLPDGAQHIIVFSFADDLVGSVQNGTHLNSAEALTAVTAYRMPMVAINAQNPQRSGPTVSPDFSAVARAASGSSARISAQSATRNNENRSLP